MEVSMRRIITLAFLVSLVSGPAAAQIVTSLDPDETYLPIIQAGNAGSVCLLNGFCITEGQGVPLNAFATTTQLNALASRIDGAITSLAGLGAQFSTFDARLTALSGQLGTINGHLTSIDDHLASIDSDVSKAFELAAVSAALKDAVPNSSDRFALRLNAAGFSGEFAGAIGVSANFNRMTRVLFNYGRGSSQNVFSGGVNLSFR
jgi:hypothetical protein